MLTIIKCTEKLSSNFQNFLFTNILLLEILIYIFLFKNQDSQEYDIKCVTSTPLIRSYGGIMILASPHEYKEILYDYK